MSLLLRSFALYLHKISYIMEKKRFALKKLLEAIEKELSFKPAKPLALNKVKNYLHGIEKPKKETLDKLSLFVGFQDWDSFKEALKGSPDYNFDEKEGDMKN